PLFRSRYGPNAASSRKRPPSRSGVSAAAIVLALIATMLVTSPRGAASDLVGLNATDVTLAVNGVTALVTYRAEGRTRHVLAWGALNARTPAADRSQVRFRHDYSGGLRTHGRAA